MDSVTHIVLGACIGEAFVGKKIRHRALLLGALAQSVPDIDIVAGSWLSPAGDLLAHRGITHSLLFALCMTPLLAWIADKWRRPHDVAFHTWLWFFGTEILVHLFLDTGNAYGTGLLEPFDHHRFSYNNLFVADPFLTLVPAVVFIILILHKGHRARMKWAILAIAYCSIYWAGSLVNKARMEHAVALATRAQHISYDRHFTTPTPFNNLLWYVVLQDSTGYYVGYHSVMAKSKDISFVHFPQQDSLLDTLRGREDVQQLIRFSQGYYTVENRHDTLLFHDLRFGQVAGWADNKAPFAFYYYLNADDNSLLIQRGRFAKWNSHTIGVLWRKMMGG